MQNNEFLGFLKDIRAKAPQYGQLLDLVEEAYTVTSMPKVDIDYHFLQAYPPGHYYSPLPSRAELASVQARVFAAPPEQLPGVNLREREQLRLVASLLPFYADMPFKHERSEGLRYYFNNDFFCQADAFFLYAMMRKLRPRRIIEVGSGFSSAVMLDTAERFLDDEVQFTFIEPYPDRLRSLLTEADKARVTIEERPIQTLDPALFTQLEANDMLFIDSSHVGKVGSDVLHELFQVLPTLKPGVVVHFHDVFYPFEYPRAWIEQAGRAWNEAYFLRAFLQYNSAFSIMLFNDWLGKTHTDMLRKHMPLCLEDTGGSLYVRVE